MLPAVAVNWVFALAEASIPSCDTSIIIFDVPSHVNGVEKVIICQPLAVCV